MRHRTAASVAVCSLVVLAVSDPAAGQGAADPAALFERGLAEMNAGKYESGCPAIAESQRLDPRAGTLFTLAECEVKWGHIASAVAHYADYLTLFSRMPKDQQERQGQRPKIATSQKAALEPQVPTLTLVVPPDAPRGLVVKRD